MSNWEVFRKSYAWGVAISALLWATVGPVWSMALYGPNWPMLLFLVPFVAYTYWWLVRGVAWSGVKREARSKPSGTVWFFALIPLTMPLIVDNDGPLAGHRYRLKQQGKAPSQLSERRAPKPTDPPTLPTVTDVQIGYKVFTLRNGFLHGARNTWTRATFEAECNGNHGQAASHIANGECACGVYSYKDRPTGLPGQVLAQVVNYGYVSPHSAGYIAQFCELQQLWVVSDGTWQQADAYAALLAEKYGVPCVVERTPTTARVLVGGHDGTGYTRGVLPPLSVGGLSAQEILRAAYGGPAYPAVQSAPLPAGATPTVANGGLYLPGQLPTVRAGIDPACGKPGCTICAPATYTR